MNTPYPQLAGLIKKEGDYKQFYYRGLHCMLIRHPDLGHWCGYAGVPKGHPLHGRDNFEDDFPPISVHGGISFADTHHYGFDDLWYFGFDAAHAYDHTPYLGPFTGEIYRDKEYCTQETISLADQLAEIAHAASYSFPF